MTAIDTFNLISSITSTVLAIVALWLSLYFYDKTKQTEERVENSLTKIQAQTESLQKINAKWMDRLTRFATEDRPTAIEGRFTEIVMALTQLPQAIATRVIQPDRNENNDQLTEELFTCYIIIHYYTALTNFWAQINIPKAGEVDENSDFVKIARRIVDGSAADFRTFEKILHNAEQRRLRANRFEYFR